MDEKWINRARLISGLVLFSYVSAHLINLSLGIASIGAMDAMLAVVILFWGHWTTQVVLGASLLVHLGLALRCLWRKRTLRMPAQETAQMVLGFAIPFMLALHVSKTRIAQTAFGAHIDYAYELLQFWVKDPAAGFEQVVLLVVCWTHACIGITFNLRLKAWYPRFKGLLLIGAFSVPFVAMIGFVRAGIVARRLAEDPAWAAARMAETGLDAADKAAILQVALVLRLTVLGLVLTLIAARYVRRWFSYRRGMITLVYGHGKRVRITRGMSVLEASQDSGIPHTSICGGRGRCSTCRTHVSAIHDADPVPEASDFEMRLMDRMHLPPGVRLACQFRPQCDVAVTPLLTAGEARRAMHQGAQMGTETEIAIMFCDLRGFTELSEHRLPYDTVFLLNRYFAAMGEPIESSGGRIDKFIGDGIMALFGIDGGPASASRQALAAAYRMSLRIDQLNQGFAHELPSPLRIGIGIHFGTVVLGEMGFGKTTGLTAIGDCVNTASRLEALCKTHGAELIVSETAERDSGLDLSPWPEHETIVRGRQAPLRIRTFPRARELAQAHLAGTPPCEAAPA